MYIHNYNIIIIVCAVLQSSIPTPPGNESMSPWSKLHVKAEILINFEIQHLDLARKVKHLAFSTFRPEFRNKSRLAEYYTDRFNLGNTNPDHFS